MIKPDPGKICFGLSKDLDRQSLAAFLQLSGQDEFSKIFAARLSSEEIIDLVDHFMKLLRKHLNENEYHRLFLGDNAHHHDEPKE